MEPAVSLREDAATNNLGRRELVYDGLAQGAESYRISQWLASE